MRDLPVLEVLLHGEPIGTITHLPGDRNLFSFNQHYIDQKERSTLSLSFKDRAGDLIIKPEQARTRLPTFFSNLLPEGHMREYLAAQAKVPIDREFYLLLALGKDLPGAIKVRAPEELKQEILSSKAKVKHDKEHMLRFSLAGLQLKFSAIWEKHGKLTIPVDGVGGSWIVKFPSAVYPKVPENEFAMMEMARQIGIDVPRTALISIDQITGIPPGLGQISNHAFIIERFDRDSDGKEVHIEDFAQVFGVFPEKKYRSASYQNIALVLWQEVGGAGIVEFIRRFVFNALIGNGDMHLKNWSLIYPDGRRAALAPAYDFVSTIPYIPQDELALRFMDSKAFISLDYRQFKRFAAKLKLPETLVIDVVEKTVKDFREVWSSFSPLDRELREVIEQHLAVLPLWQA